MKSTSSSPAALWVACQNPQRYRDVAVRELSAWTEDLVRAIAPAAGSFAVRFTSDREVQRLNQRFRDKDKPTDVLSFPGEETVEGFHVGDVVISVPTARRQAESAGHSVERELRVLVLHGLLHCLGHDHEVDDGEMMRLERRLRRRWIHDV